LFLTVKNRLKKDDGACRQKFSVTGIVKSITSLFGPVTKVHTSLLWDAVKCNRTDVISAYLFFQPKGHQLINQGETPLHLAVELGHVKSCDLLISLGANVKAVDSNKKTPLDIAKLNNNEKVIKCFQDKTTEHDTSTGPSKLRLNK